MPVFQWSAPKNERFIKMWNDGDSIREITRVFKCSMPAVYRQAHALGLTPREGTTPTVKQAAEKPATPRPLPPGAHTLPPLPSEENHDVRNPTGPDT